MHTTAIFGRNYDKKFKLLTDDLLLIWDKWNGKFPYAASGKIPCGNCVNYMSNVTSQKLIPKYKEKYVF